MNHEKMERGLRWNADDTDAGNADDADLNK